MSIYIIVPASRDAAMRAAYLAERVIGRDNPTEPEGLNWRVEGSTGLGRMITGSSRISIAAARRLGTANAWLTTATAWPADWVYPTIG